jgi:syntaxin 16
LILPSEHDAASRTPLISPYFSHPAAPHTEQAHTQSLSLTQADPDTAQLHARDRELTEIAKSIASLAELFKDLSTLVIDQGTVLDSVEYNIEQTATHVSDAVKELNTATQYVDSYPPGL